MIMRIAVATLFVTVLAFSNLSYAMILSPTPNAPTFRNTAGEPMDRTSISSESQVMVYQTFHNNDRLSRNLLMLFEIRDVEGVSIYIAWQIAQVDPESSKEVGISWVAPNPGEYQIRTFPISNFTNPEVLGSVEFADFAVIQPSEALSDEDDSREIRVYSLLASDPSLAKYRTGVYGHSEDVRPLRREASGAWVDNASMHVVKEEAVEGSWQTGYTLTYKGVMDVSMEIRSAREILSIKETGLPDSVRNYTFSESDKTIIQAALSNSTVTQSLQSKQSQGKTTFVNGVMYNGYFAGSSTCPPANCARVHFQVENTKQVMVVWLHSVTGIVARIDMSSEWEQDCRQFACKES
jgi:hypothetical protein